MEWVFLFERVYKINCTIGNVQSYSEVNAPIEEVIEWTTYLKNSKTESMFQYKVSANNFHTGYLSSPQAKNKNLDLCSQKSYSEDPNELLKWQSVNNPGAMSRK